METKHTPGPWAAEFVIPQHSADGYWQIQASQKPDGALVVADVAECPEIDENARLIAAAPDLLAALDETADALAEFGKLVQDGAFDAAEDWADANVVLIVDRARAAIAKAGQ